MVLEVALIDVTDSDGFVATYLGARSVLAVPGLPQFPYMGNGH